MKRVLLAVGTCFVLAQGTPAWAEQRSATSTGDTEIVACANAKHDAELACDSGRVQEFEDCDCEEGMFPAGDEWQCSVDATCEDDDDE